MAFWDSVLKPTETAGFWNGVIPHQPSVLARITQPSFTTKTSTQALPDASTGSTFDEVKGLAQAIPRDAAAIGTAVGQAAESVPLHLYEGAQALGIQVKPSVLQGAKDQAGRAYDTATALTPTGANRVVLGTKPIENFAQTAATYQRNGLPLGLAVFGAVAPTGADFLGLGGEEAALKAVLKASTEADALRVLTKLGITEEAAQKLVPRVVSIGTPEEAKTFLSDLKTIAEPHIPPQAQTDWETNFADRAAQLETKYQSLAQQLKTATAADRVALEGQQKTVLQDIVDHENAFIEKWKTPALVDKTGLSSADQGELVPQSPLRDQRVGQSGDALRGGELINTKRLLISPEGKQLVTKTVEEVKPLIEEFTGATLSNKEALAFAENSSKTLSRAVGREQTLAWESSMLKARQKLAAASESGAVDEDYIKTLIQVKTQATDIARKLQSLSIGAEPIEQTGKQAILEAVLKTNQNADAIIKAAQGVDFRDLRQATEFYRKFIKPTAGEWLDLFRYSSMLSSPKTHIVNIVSNLLNTSFMAPLEKALTGGLDFLGSKITGRGRKYFAGEGAAYFVHYLSNVKQATINMVDVMRGKQSYTNLDTRNIPIATKGVKGAVVSTLALPSRLLEAMDRFFLTLGEGGEMGALKYRAGKGVKMGNLESEAQREAAYRLYRQKPGETDQGYLLRGIDELTLLVQRARNSKITWVAQAAKFTVPFLQTPMNIFKQGIEYSPLGFVNLIGAAKKTETLSRAIIGSSVFAGAATLLGSSRLTFGEPVDANGKRDFRAAKQQAYSIKLGNTWYSYQKLPPAIAFPFAMVAAINDIQRQRKIDDTTVDLVLAGIAKYGQFLSDQSYAKSIGDMLAAVQGGEEGLAKVGSNYVQQLIPYRALGGWMARLADPLQRKIDPDASLLDKQVQLLMLNVPGLSDNVPARLDAEGKPIAQPNRIGNAFSPVQTTNQSPAEAAKYEALLEYKKLKKNESEVHSKAKDKIQPIYDEAQAYLRSGDTAAAKALVDGLSKEDYEVYKDIRTADHSANTSQLRVLLHTSPTDAVKFLRVQLPAEQQRLLKVMTKEEYQLYEKGKSTDATTSPQANAGTAAKLLGALTGAQTAHAAEPAAPGSLVEQPRSFWDKVTGKSEVVRTEGSAGPAPEAVVEAIGQNETRGVKGDPYTFSQPSGNPKLGKALGKYQVTEAFLKKYAERYLGRTVTSKEFLATPALQDAFMKSRVLYLTHLGYTPEQIADIHRNGSTNEPGATTYKRPGYVAQFSTHLGRE